MGIVQYHGFDLWPYVILHPLRLQCSSFDKEKAPKWLGKPQPPNFSVASVLTDSRSL